MLGPLHLVKYPHSASKAGTYLLYSDFTSEDVYLLNTKTGVKNYINFQSMLPSNMRYEFFKNAVFCHYDDDIFMVHLSVSIDTNGNNQNFTLGYHIFIYEVKSDTLTLVTPSVTGKLGVNLV